MYQLSSCRNVYIWATLVSLMLELIQLSRMQHLCKFKGVCMLHMTGRLWQGTARVKCSQWEWNTQLHQAQYVPIFKTIVACIPLIAL